MSIVLSNQNLRNLYINNNVIAYISNTKTMDLFYFFLILGSIAVYLILRFDKQQRRKANTLLHQTNDVQPLFLIKSLEQKLNRLNAVLAVNTTESVVGDRLKKITADYNHGHINIQAYNNRLSELLREAEAH